MHFLMVSSWTDPTNVEIEKALRYPTLLCVLKSWFEVQTSFWFPLLVIIIPLIILYCNMQTWACKIILLARNS
jgi:hypothetical protein